jgi:hypothetical protein
MTAAVCQNQQRQSLSNKGLIVWWPSRYTCIGQKQDHWTSSNKEE